jgi:hypothetical protein
MNKSFKSAASIILVVVILLVGYFGTYDYYGKMGVARDLKASSEAENARLEKALSDIQAFVNDYNGNLSQSRMAEKALPVGDPDTAELLDYYSRLVTDSGLALIDLSMMEGSSSEESAAQARDSIQSIDWEVEASGSFESLKDYLQRVKQGLRLTDVISVSTSMADAVAQDGRLMRYSLKLRTYYQK